jgi:hypothetical protein
LGMNVSEFVASVLNIERPTALDAPNGGGD